MGRAKQLLKVGGESLVRRAARTALDSGCDAVVVVIGAHREAVERELGGLPVTLAFNPAWKTGMASSIRTGVASAREAEPEAEGILLTLADQPHVTAALLDQLRAALRQGGVQRVACRYAGSVGVPAAFGRALFAELADLKGPRGAKDLLTRPGEDLVTIDSEEPRTDVDTPDDYARLARAEVPTELKAHLAEHTRAFILTLRRDGSPTAHPMTALGEPSELVFNTYRKSAKARNIQRDARVGVLYIDGYDTSRPSGFAVEGRGEIRVAAQLPGRRTDQPVTQALADRTNARLAAGKRILIDVTPERVRRVEAP